MTACPHCGQPMPVAVRHDEPLPPLDFPNLVTIHDLPDPSKAKVVIERSGTGLNIYQLDLSGMVVAQ